MKKQTFKRGLHIRDEKDATKSRPIRELVAPPLLYFALNQHIGAPLSPLAKPGERVLMRLALESSLCCYLKQVVPLLRAVLMQREWQ